MNTTALSSSTSIGQVHMDTSRLAPQNLGEVVRFAEVMARGDIALPERLRGNAGACMAIALYALDVGMNPFAVASKAYFIKGALAFEAQFITALINTKANLAKRLDYQYEGSGDTLTCTIVGEFKDGSTRTYTSPPVGSIPTKNSPLWKADPEQQLGYYSARAWARRHCPEVIMGIYTPDEMDGVGPDSARNITPSKHDYAQRLEAAMAETVVEFTGFNVEHVHAEIETATGGTGKPVDEPKVVDDTDTTEGAPTPPYEEEGLEHVSIHVGKAMIDAFEMELAACETEQEVMDLSQGYASQINEADAETKKQAKLLRAKRIQEIAEGSA